jgi:methylphosphotriester-DNA--protein-cysteine methyltransferase
MNPKLEELRRRFLPGTPFVPTPEPIFRSGPQVSQELGPSEQLPPANSAEPAEPGDALTAQSSPEAEPLAERVTDNRDGQIAVEKPKPVDQLGQAVAKLFEPAQRCKEHLAEIAKASDSILRLVGSALERFEELKSFRDHMRRLSNSFASMRAFQDDLGVLAESFEPVKALHQQVIQLADGVRTHLAEVAESLEPANALRAQTAELAQILGVGTQLQAQFYELSKAFGAVPADGASVKSDSGKMA